MAESVFFKTFPLDSTPFEHRGMGWPAGEFDPLGEWTQAWDICSLAGRRGASIGSVTLRRFPARNGLFDLGVFYRKRIYYVGDSERFYWHQTRAVLHCREDALATAEDWEFETHSEDWEGRVKPGTRIGARGKRNGKGYEVRQGSVRRQLEAPSGRAAVSWALFEAAQRWPREMQPVDFDLMDHFDQPKHEQKLRFWKSEELLDGTEPGRAATLSAFEQRGRGVLPLYYWRDAAGRLLFVISGTEGYVFNPESVVDF